LSELSIEKRFKEQGLSVKVGRLGLGSDFDVMACDFVSNAFCAAQILSVMPFVPHKWGNGRAISG